MDMSNDRDGLLDRLIAPLRWLEQATGWRWWGLVLLYLVVGGSVGVFGWRAVCLWRLPDIGEPFDVARLGTVDLADSDNAMVPYREAARKLIAGSGPNYRTRTRGAWEVVRWGAAEPDVRRWVVENREAMDLWLRGTDRSDSLFVQPRDLTRISHTVATFSLRGFARMGLLEASRLEADGDVNGAWRMLRAVVRSSRHIGQHGDLDSRVVGEAIFHLARPEVERWLDDPRVTPALLKRALADLETARAMTPPPSEMVRSHYFASNAILSDPVSWANVPWPQFDANSPWQHQLRALAPALNFLWREPERTLRVLRLVTANQLAQVDRPRGERSALLSTKHAIFAADPKSPGPITPEELAAWADRSAYVMLTENQTFIQGKVEAEAGQFDGLLVLGAERAFELEHGRPARTYGELLGPYLKRLPEGIEPGDLTGLAADPN